MPTTVEEFKTKEERNTRFFELLDREKSLHSKKRPRGLVRFSESVPSGEADPEQVIRQIKRRKKPWLSFTRKIRFLRQEPGHCVWYVAWES